MSPSAPIAPPTKNAPNGVPRSDSVPANRDKLVPNPTRDPPTSSGARLDSQIDVRANKPALPDVAKPPQLRFTPVPPRGPVETDAARSRGSGSRDAPGGETTTDVRVSPPTLSQPNRDDERTSSAKSTRSNAGPSLGFEPLPAPEDAPLSLQITAPRQRPVGGTVTFDVLARNDGNAPLSNVVIRVEFEEALVFPGSDEKRLQKNLGALDPGQSRDLRLTLASNRLGKHVCRFWVQADGVEAREHAATVEFIDPKLLVRLIGPARRTVGSRAEFTVKVANTSDQPIDDLEVTLHHDAVLNPHVATGGFQKEDHALRWSLGRLDAGAGVQVQAEFDCKQLSEQACISAEARSEKLSAVAVEDCVTVVAVPGLIDLRVADITDPVKVGDDAEFEITVQNLGLQAASEVQLEVTTSEHLRAGTPSAKIGDRDVMLTHTDQEGVQRLVLRDPLPADAQLTVTLRAKVLRPGDAELRAVATDRNGNSVETIEFTSINP